MPVSVAEALSMGKIVVASNVGGISEMITHKENGFLFNKGDIDALQEIILDILEGHVDCASMTSNARKRARETFHPAGVAERTVDFYRTLASHPKEETSNE